MSQRQLTILQEFPRRTFFLKVNIVTSNTRAVTQARRISSDVAKDYQSDSNETTLPTLRLTCSKALTPFIRTCGHSLLQVVRFPRLFSGLGSINCPQRRSHDVKEPSCDPNIYINQPLRLCVVTGLDVSPPV
ncbi:hypothetical protein JTE90_016257 [Oedothorax gibbosus]|uniref:Uncharacterized protein n=1 Tax=Oedothorax gibbosus TaxID=931172 RepID=A0AAV6VRJ7_9ARAC|nr:hypothetical protein JTE90_016257 [Oedothorax gibbosus]